MMALLLLENNTSARGTPEDIEICERDWVVTSSFHPYLVKGSQHVSKAARALSPGNPTFAFFAEVIDHYDCLWLEHSSV